MFFLLKKKLMGKMIERRNKQHPFDSQYAENFSLEGSSDPVMNNSYYFSAHDEGMSLFVRLGKRVNAEETWFALYLKNRTYSLKQEFFRVGDAPMTIGKEDGNWTISFQGTLNDNDQAIFHGKFTALQKPIYFSSDMPAERMAIGLANEKWTRSLFTQLQTISGQCHYEQEGILEGELTLNGEKTEFHLPCVRDHSFGKRDWNYMNNHLWLMAVSPSVQFNYSLVSYPAMTVLEVGNCRDESGLHYMLQADLELQQINQGTVPRALSFHVRLDDDRTILVSARVLTGVTYHFQDGQYVLHENVAEFIIDGKVCRGILEIGFNRDRSRYFNQRELSGIKR